MYILGGELGTVSMNVNTKVIKNKVYKNSGFEMGFISDDLPKYVKRQAWVNQILVLQRPFMF